MYQFRCSKLSRVMHCAGSSFLEHREEPPSDAAKEGTAAGELLRHWLEKPGQPDITIASNGVAINDDMKFHLEPLAKDIFERATSPILCETKVDWYPHDNVMLMGSYDVSYVNREGKLCIDDLKYGWGIVEVEENWQLLGYAIGEMIRRQEYFPSVVLRILQPRPHHEKGQVREWELTYDQLLHFKDRIEKRMESIAGGYRELQSGSHCRYCPAAHGCPSLSKAFYNSVDVAHRFLQDSISDEELSRQLDLIERVEDLVKIKRDSIKALAVNRIKEGRLIPGWVTEKSLGHRAWKKEVTPQFIKLMTGKDITRPEMLSPAQAEKIIPKEFIATLTERFVKGMTVVRGSGSEQGNKIFGTEKPV